MSNSMPKAWERPTDYNLLPVVFLVLGIAALGFAGYLTAVHETFENAPKVESATLVYEHFTIEVWRGEIAEIRIDEYASALHDLACDSYQPDDNGHSCVIAAKQDFPHTLDALDVLTYAGLPYIAR